MAPVAVRYSMKALHSHLLLYQTWRALAPRTSAFSCRFSVKKKKKINKKIVEKNSFPFPMTHYGTNQLFAHTLNIETFSESVSKLIYLFVYLYLHGYECFI